ncbi:GH12 family glycosyl hydrolase domain-containing protein [Paraburkholderia megapolitana]|uniref:GH12 family glycosyl hydrolase domain-containing protein n=1 Tax=Paraburkholderia megapolitana TaxID=420953 RepID=UPI0038B96495
MRAQHLRFTSFWSRVRSTLVSLFVLVAGAFCASAAHAQTCLDGQYSSLSQGAYTLQNDEWGLNGDSGGWQQICSGSASSGSFSSTWYWSTGTGSIKAYPGIYRGWQDGGSWSPDAGGFPQQISVQGSMPTSVSFSMSGNNQYDAAYDLFFSPSTNPGSPSAEMMVWLSYSGNQPAGSKVASGVSLGGMSGTWDVWSGNVGWPVYTFVRDAQVTSFSGNLQPFVYYLSYTNSWLNRSWYEMDIQFGAEIIQSNGANGSINVSNFSASAN